MREWTVVQDEDDMVTNEECEIAFETYFSRFMETDKSKQTLQHDSKFCAHRPRQAAYDLMKAMFHAMQVMGCPIYQFVLRPLHQ
jgi:hypothetical protein